MPLLCIAPNAQAQTAPTNDQLLTDLIASAQPGSDFVQSGDMILSVDALRAYQELTHNTRSAASSFDTVVLFKGAQSFQIRVWKDGVVPYEFDPTLPQSERTAFTDGFREWEKVANLKFVLRNGQSDHIRVRPIGGSVSSSQIGRIGGGQDLFLSSGVSKFISNAVGATIVKSKGVVTLTNDDVAAASTSTSSASSSDPSAPSAQNVETRKRPRFARLVSSRH